MSSSLLLFYLMCVCARVHIHVCVSTGVTCHGTHKEVGRQTRVGPPFLPPRRQGFLPLTAAQPGELALPGASGDFPVAASHLPEQELGLQTL